MSSPPAPADRGGTGPASPAAMFFAFNRLALQGFGGVLAVAQVELVERRGWVTKDEFLDTLSVAQVLPGPNVVNLSLMLGDRYFGLSGAAASLAGLLALPLAIVLCLAALYGQFAQWPLVAGALRGMGVVAAGLIIATALKLRVSLKNHPLGMPLCLAFAALTFAAVALLRWPLVAVIGGLGSVAIACAWRALKRR
jgi:chromate transporter